ncbi:glucose/galactose transporter WARNING [Sphingobacterium spiritivorum ATCC 33300]|uniref:Glucose/galactose transporter WARNING n=1 Tax=Sphingobacterium spiritivorum ATCC 33300 TaxID=525372 RepID=C2FZX5_SPHSI|nr:sugar MFS transporter [Sphingobacterium spiritivorum]EEI91571.1 glucose/galactose transporter WARNING [Sphingobacterium spiritivorum ATCC 33300]QQS97286.1 sugar MFS transporter [Sphingobacterium spiritivorum]
MTNKPLNKRDTAISVGIIGMMFFIFGFVSWINAILIPYFKIACELTNFQSYLVAFAFYISYLVMSLPSSLLLKKIGFKKGIMVGFWTMALGALIFVPAAYSRAYPVFLLGLFTLGAGLAILQTVANLYITVVGNKERAAQRISIMGICNKGAGILAPLAFSAAILRPTDGELFRQIPLMSDVVRAAVLDELIMRVVIPYTIVACVLFIIGIAVRYSPLPELTLEDDTDNKAGKKNILQFPHLVLGAIAIFLHVGTQVIAIDTVISYADTMGLTLIEAKVFPSYTLTATIIGYLLGIVVIPRFISQRSMLKICTLTGLLLSLSIHLFHGQVDWLNHHVDISIWFVVLIGLPNALIWAGIWPLALDGLGKYAKEGSALLIMGLCGNAILPLIYGVVADVSNVQTAYAVLIPCFLYLVFYAFIGHKIKNW